MGVVFQGHLQDVLDYLASTGYSEWNSCFSRGTISCTVLPHISLEGVRSMGVLLPPLRLSSWDLDVRYVNLESCFIFPVGASPLLRAFIYYSAA